MGSSFGKYDLLQLSGCAQLLHLALVGVEVLGVSIERRKSKHNSRSILRIYFIVIIFGIILDYQSLSKTIPFLCTCRSYFIQKIH